MSITTPRLQTLNQATNKLNDKVNNNVLTKVYGTNAGMNKLKSLYGTSASAPKTMIDTKANDATVNETENILNDYIKPNTYTPAYQIDTTTSYENLLKELSGGQGYDATKDWKHQEFKPESEWSYQDIIKAENAYDIAPGQKEYYDNMNADLQQLQLDKENKLRDLYLNGEFAKKNLQSNLESRGLGSSGIASSFDNELWNNYLNNVNSTNVNYQNNLNSLNKDFRANKLGIEAQLNNLNGADIENYETEARQRFENNLLKLQYKYGEESDEYWSAYKDLLDKYKNTLSSQDYNMYKKELNVPIVVTNTAKNTGFSLSKHVPNIGDNTVKDENGNEFDVHFGDEVKENNILVAGKDIKDGQVFAHNQKLYIKKYNRIYLLEKAKKWPYKSSDYDKLYSKVFNS